MPSLFHSIDPAGLSWSGWAERERERGGGGREERRGPWDVYLSPQKGIRGSQWNTDLAFACCCHSVARIHINIILKNIKTNYFIFKLISTSPSLALLTALAKRHRGDWMTKVCSTPTLHYSSVLDRAAGCCYCCEMHFRTHDTWSSEFWEFWERVMIDWQVCWLMMKKKQSHIDHI